MREELLGDLEERFHFHEQGKEKSATLWYVIEVLRLLPYLVFKQTRRFPVRIAVTLFGVGAFALIPIIMWEAIIVKQNAWPLTQSLLNASPLSGKSLFLIIYGIIYLLGIVAILSLSALGMVLFKRQLGWTFDRTIVVLCIALTAPSVFYIVRPQPLDSISMRLFIIATVYILLIGVTVFRGKMRNA